MSAEEFAEAVLAALLPAREPLFPPVRWELAARIPAPPPAFPPVRWDGEDGTVELLLTAPGGGPGGILFIPPGAGAGR